MFSDLACGPTTLLTPLFHWQWIRTHQRRRVQVEIQRDRLQSRGAFKSPREKNFKPTLTMSDNGMVTVLQLVNKSTNEIAAQSHSRIRNSFFRKPRDMSLEISAPISHAVDIVLLTFLLVWRERKTERIKDVGESYPDMVNLPPLPSDDLCEFS